MKQTTEQQRDVTKFVYLVKRQRREAIFDKGFAEADGAPCQHGCKKNENSDESNKHADDPVVFF